MSEIPGFCFSCGVALASGARFCGSCGSAVATPTPPVSPLPETATPSPDTFQALPKVIAPPGVMALPLIPPPAPTCFGCGAKIPDDIGYCAACVHLLRLPDDSTRPVVEEGRTREVKESKGVSPKTLVLFVAAALIIAALAGKVLLEQFRRASGATPPTSPTTSPNPTQGLSVLLNGLQVGSQPLADMLLQEKTPGTFLRPNDRGDVLGVPVESIQYFFGDNKRLWMVTHKVSAANAAPLLTAIKRAFAEPDWTDKDGYLHWYEPKGDQKNCILGAGYAIEESGEANVYVMSCPLMREEFLGSVVADPGIAVVRGTTIPDPGDVTSFLVGTIYGDQNLPQSESLKFGTIMISQLCPTCSFKRETMRIVSYEQGSLDIGEHARSGIQIRRIKCGAIVALFNSVETHTNKVHVLCFLVSAAGDPTTGTWHWVRSAPCQDADEFLRAFRDLPGYEKDANSPSIHVPQ